MRTQTVWQAFQKYNDEFKVSKFYKIDVDEKIFGVKLDNKNINPKSQFLPKQNMNTYRGSFVTSKSHSRNTESLPSLLSEKLWHFE